MVAIVTCKPIYGIMLDAEICWSRPVEAASSSAQVSISVTIAPVSKLTLYDTMGTPIPNRAGRQLISSTKNQRRRDC